MKVSVVTQPTPEHNSFSPMKIMQDPPDDEKKYLVLNNYHPAEPFKDILSAKSQLSDPFMTSNPLLLSASSHRDDNVYYR